VPGPGAIPLPGISPTAIAFDIDGVIADTMTLFLDIARAEYGIRGVRYEDITSYLLEDCLEMDPGVIDRIITRIMDGDYTAPLTPIAGAPEFLNRLAGRCDTILFVTARPYIGPIDGWIRSLMPSAGPAAIDIVATGSFEAKTDVLSGRNIAHFVEDRLETCFALSAAGIVPILFTQPWNRQPHPFIEVSSWGELSGLIQW
jgi:hypothetical protein